MYVVRYTVIKLINILAALNKHTPVSSIKTGLEGTQSALSQYSHTLLNRLAPFKDR